MTLHAITYGAIITSLTVPDRDGRTGDVVLGHASLDGYLENDAYLGAVIGRHANRIANGCFTLDGRSYQLETNDGAHHLHGGRGGFHTRLWDAELVQEGEHAGVAFSYWSEDGEANYPGGVRATVSYLLDGNGVISVRYIARSTAATILNLTQHSYFNLAGAGTILDHELTLYADDFTPVRVGQIPTGSLAPVDRTAFDFRTSTPIGRRLHEDDIQLRLAQGYDHNWVIRRFGPGLVPAAVLRHTGSGRQLRIDTTEPGVQFYSGNLLDGTITGRGGHVYAPHAGLCLETQHFPDAPNQPTFPSTTLRPGETFASATTWQFSTF